MFSDTVSNTEKSHFQLKIFNIGLLGYKLKYYTYFKCHAKHENQLSTL